MVRTVENFLALLYRRKGSMLTVVLMIAIVTQLFPGKMRDQVMANQNQDLKLSKRASTRISLKSFMIGENGGEMNDEGNRPLAELFLETTILFGDIVGFTGKSRTIGKLI
jgi:hypothetical protein